MVKVCTSCGAAGDADLFYRRALSPDGLTTRCKTCVNNTNAAYQMRHADKYRAYKAYSYQKNKEKYAEARRQWVRENPSLSREREKARYQRRKEYDALYRQIKRKNDPDYRLREIARSSVAKMTGLSRSEVPLALVEARTVYISILRRLRQR